MTPLFSILTVSYNSVQTIEKTILSVINQTYKNKEYIIIDGGSTDGTVEIIKKYEQYINYWTSEPDKGLYNAMNKGVKKASGRWINFMNCGDLFSSERVLEQIAHLNHNYDIFCGIAITHNRYWIPVKENNLSLHFFITDTLNHQSAFIKKELLLESPYDEKLKIASDTKFFFEMLIIKNVSYKALNLEICICDKPLISHNREESMKERIAAIKSFFPCKCQQSIELLFILYNPVALLATRIYTSSFMKIILSVLRPIKRIINSKRY